MLIVTAEHFGQGFGIPYVKQYPLFLVDSGDIFAFMHLKQNRFVVSTPLVVSGKLISPSASVKWKTLLPLLFTE